MSTKIQPDFTFQAGVHYENRLLMNVYNMSLIIYVEVNCPKEQHIAMERIKYFLSEHVENTVFVDEKEKKAIDRYIDANIKVCTLPNEPYDQVVMQALLLKFNSITEGRFVIAEVILSSKMSDDVKFFGDIEEIDEEFAKSEGWWFDSSTSMSTLNRINKKEKIVKLHTHSKDWSECLQWELKTEKCDAAEIIFTNSPEKTPI
jgi:hypothetical protein